MKIWAKAQNINSSKDGTLNSLSIILLVAFHLQVCSNFSISSKDAVLVDIKYAELTWLTLFVFIRFLDFNQARDSI